MTAEEYLNSLEADRRAVIAQLREFIIKHDKNIRESVEGMMGRQMLVYKTAEGILKYALASVKMHMSFHSMVMYDCSGTFGGPGLHARYEKLLPKAKFQKACINFKNADQMPPDVFKKLIIDCAAQEYPPAAYKERMLKSEARRRAANKKGE